MISRLKNPALIYKPSISCSIHKPNFESPESIEIGSEEFIVTELDKIKVYNGILEKDEIGIVDESNERHFYVFNENLPEILARNLGVETKNTKAENEDIDIDELLEALNKDAFRKILLTKDFVTFVDIYWPVYCNVSRPYGEFLISAYPIERNVPLAIKNTNKVVTIDILPFIKGNSKCVDTDELLERLIKRYRAEWENNFGKWNEKFENKKPVYVS
jgi:hypothetical protein